MSDITIVKPPDTAKQYFTTNQEIAAATLVALKHSIVPWNSIRLSVEYVLFVLLTRHKLEELPIYLTEHNIKTYRLFDYLNPTFVTVLNLVTISDPGIEQAIKTIASLDPIDEELKRRLKKRAIIEGKRTESHDINKIKQMQTEVNTLIQHNTIDLDTGTSRLSKLGDFIYQISLESYQLEADDYFTTPDNEIGRNDLFASLGTYIAPDREWDFQSQITEGMIKGYEILYRKAVRAGVQEFFEPHFLSLKRRFNPYSKLRD